MLLFSRSSNCKSIPHFPIRSLASPLFHSSSIVFHLNCLINQHLLSYLFALQSLFSHLSFFRQRNYLLEVFKPFYLPYLTNQPYPFSFNCWCQNYNLLQFNLAFDLQLVCLTSQFRAFLSWLDSCAKGFFLLFGRDHFA